MGTEIERPIFGGQVYDLDTGRVTDLVGPLQSKQPVRVLGAASDDERVVVIGQRCGETDSSEGFCVPATVGSFSLDPTTGTWMELTLPADLVGRPVQYASKVAASAEQGFVAVVQMADQDQPSLLHLVGAKWQLVTSLDADPIIGECLAGSRYYRLYRSGGATEQSQSIDPAEAVTTRLVSIDLRTGRTEPHKTPPLGGAIGGAGIAFGCTPSGPLLATGAPAITSHGAEPTSVHRLTSEGWKVVPDVLAAAGDRQVYPGEILSGPEGAIVGGRTGTADGGPNVFTLDGIDADGDVEALDPQLSIDRTLIWQGLTGSAFLVDLVSKSAEADLRTVRIW